MYVLPIDGTSGSDDVVNNQNLDHREFMPIPSITAMMVAILQAPAPKTSQQTLGLLPMLPL